MHYGKFMKKRLDYSYRLQLDYKIGEKFIYEYRKLKYIGT